MHAPVNPRGAALRAHLRYLLAFLIGTGALGISCDRSQPPLTLILTVSGVPMQADGYQLKVSMRLDGKPQVEPPFTVPDSMPRFAVTVPIAPDRTSALEIYVSAETPGGCRLGEASKAVSVSKDYAGGDIEFQLAAFSRARCPLTLAVSGDGSVTIAPIGARCTSSCSYEFDTGTMLTLSAAVGPSSRAGSWGAGCAATALDMPCALRADRALHVELNLPLRPCSPDGVCSYSLPSGVTTGLNAVASVNGSATEFWAAGTGGTVISTTGGEWARVPAPLPTQNVLALAGLSNQTVYFAGSTGVEARTPALLTPQVCGLMLGTLVRGAWAFTSTRAWFAGDGGQVAMLVSGTCTAATTGTTNTLYGVGGVDTAFVFAVGEQGTILRYDGTQWTPAPSPTSNRLRAVAFDSRNNGWAVGSGGTVLRWNGVQWNLSTSGVTAELHAVLARSVTEAWAAGDSGTLLRFDGTSWVPMALPGGSRANLRGVAGNTTDTWAVGSNGEIFRATRK
jgi:hypothetical protein